MIKRIVAVVFVFACTSVAWLILGGTLKVRTDTQDNTLQRAVGQLWGKPQVQAAPIAYYTTSQQVEAAVKRDGKTVKESRTQRCSHAVPITGSRVDVALELEHRRKGLLWYSAYRIRFAGAYRVLNPTSEGRNILFVFTLPAKDAIYDGFRLAEGGHETTVVEVNDGAVQRLIWLEPGQEIEVSIAYSSQGLGEWAYALGGEGVSQVRSFLLTMTTNFAAIDFPVGSHSPTHKEALPTGWMLTWSYDNLLSGERIGMVLPQRLNPGPWAAQVSFAAPVSLFLFFFVVLLAATLQEVRVHPMNYFFLAAAFFSFHLLLAYLIDHVSIHAAFISSSAVSIGLVVSYMRLVTGGRFATRVVALAQLVYLVFFSYTFFFAGYTGLAITVLCIVTLFLAMQWTGRVDWEEVFRRT